MWFSNLHVVWRIIFKDWKPILSSGYAKDLGLYMPEENPVLSQEELKRLSSCSYTELVYEVACKFIDEAEIPREDLQGEEYNLWEYKLIFLIIFFVSQSTGRIYKFLRNIVIHELNFCKELVILDWLAFLHALKHLSFKEKYCISEWIKLISLSIMKTT